MALEIAGLNLPTLADPARHNRSRSLRAQPFRGRWFCRELRDVDSGGLLHHLARDCGLVPTPRCRNWNCRDGRAPGRARQGSILRLVNARGRATMPHFSRVRDPRRTHLKVVDAYRSSVLVHHLPISHAHCSSFVRCIASFAYSRPRQRSVVPALLADSVLLPRPCCPRILLAFLFLRPGRGDIRAGRRARPTHQTNGPGRPTSPPPPPAPPNSCSALNPLPAPIIANRLACKPDGERCISFAADRQPTPGAGERPRAERLPWLSFGRSILVAVDLPGELYRHRHRIVDRHFPLHRISVPGASCFLYPIHRYPPLRSFQLSQNRMNRA